MISFIYIYLIIYLVDNDKFEWFIETDTRTTLLICLMYLSAIVPFILDLFIGVKIILWLMN